MFTLRTHVLQRPEPFFHSRLILISIRVWAVHPCLFKETVVNHKAHTFTRTDTQTVPEIRLPNPLFFTGTTLQISWNFSSLCTQERCVSNVTGRRMDYWSSVLGTRHFSSSLQRQARFWRSPSFLWANLSPWIKQTDLHSFNAPPEHGSFAHGSHHH
jgi:hypothetical protein